MLLKTKKTDVVVGAYFDGHEWNSYNSDELPQETMSYGQMAVSDHQNLINAIRDKSKRSALLHGIFVNPYKIGNVMLDKPVLLFLLGQSYLSQDEIKKLNDLETIIDNQKVDI